MTALPTLVVDGNGDGTTHQPRDWATQDYTNIDEGIAAADGVTILSPIAATGKTSFTLEAFPADLDNVDTLTITVRCASPQRVDDLNTIFAKLIDPADGSLLAGGTSVDDMQLVKINPATTQTDYGPITFADVTTTATKAQWDSAILILHVGYSAVGDPDFLVAIRVDTIDIDGTYTATAGLTPVGADEQAVWDVLATVNADQQTVWDVLAGVNADQQAVWDVLEAVAVDEQVIWELYSTVAATGQAVWDVHSTVGADQQTVWDLLATVGVDGQAVWNIQATVAADEQAVWDVLAAVNADLQVIWDVLAALNAVGADMQAVWNLQAAIGADQQIVWNVLSLLIIPDIGRAHLLAPRWRAELDPPRWKATLEPTRWAAELTQGPP